jgi:hypothetical protein
VNLVFRGRAADEFRTKGKKAKKVFDKKRKMWYDYLAARVRSAAYTTYTVDRGA